MRYQWWIHGHINFVLLSSSAFCDLYDKVVQPDEPTEAYQTLQGFRTRSVDVAGAMWALSRIVKDSPTLTKLFAKKRRPRSLAELDKSDEGRDFHRQLDEFLEEFGWRHDAVYDLADVPWREDASIPLSSINGMVDLDDGEDPEVLYRQTVSQREELLARARRSCPAIPTSSRSSTSSTKPPATASRSPRTTPSTSISSASACSAASPWPSAIGSCRRA